MTNLIKKGFTVSVVVTTILWAVGLAAFMPFGASAAAMEGDLIKMDGLSSVYYYAGGERYVFPNEKTYFSWYSDFSGVKTISQAELEAIPLGDNVVIRPGTKLVKITTDPKVYAVGPSGVLHHVDSEARATTLYGANWAQRVVDVPDAFFTNYEIGTAISSDVHPEGSLVKYADSADMYYINAAGEKQKFASMDAFNANRFKLSDVVTISDTLTYSAGDDISGADSDLYDTSQGHLEGGGSGVAGTLAMALASDTPAATSVPVSANNAHFTYVNLTAGADPVTVTGVKATRFGLGADSNFSSVKLFVDGIQVGNSQSLNSNHQAVFSGISISVPANSTKKLVLAGSMAAGGTAGHLLGLSIASAADITTTASVSGSFPIQGNQMTVSSVNIGTATLYNGSLHPTTDTSVDTDGADFRFTQVKLTAGGEDLKISQVTAVRNGTAGDSDVKNIELYNDTAGSSLGTVESLTNGKAVFSGLNVTVAKGESVELSILADMNGGAGRTIAFDMHDGVAYTIMVEGLSYGFGITPTRNNFCNANGTCQTQTINQGYLTISKSPSTPATGNIPQGGSLVTLAAFDYKAVGESINVSQTQLTITPAAGGSAVDYSNVGLYDADGGLVAGTQDGSTTTANTAQTLTFTDAYTVPVDTSTYYVKANVSSSAVANETVAISMPVNSITGKGANSGKTTYTTSSGTTVPPAAAVTCNTLTVQGPALKVITAATPVAGNMVVNAQGQVFAYIDLDATSGGEDAKVTQVVVQSTYDGGPNATSSDITNLELWGDPDNTDDTTEDILLETSNSTASMTDATTYATTTFTFKTPIKVSHLAVSRLTLKADVASSFTAGATHTFNVDGTNATVTSVGWSTGNGITETYSGNGQTQTLQTVGQLKVEYSADRASAAQFVAGTTGNSMMSYKMTASYESIDVTQFTVATTGGSANADIARVKVYVDGEQVGATGGYTLDAGGDALVTLSSGTLVVPKDDYVVVTLKVDLSERTQLTDAATLEIGLGDASGDDGDWGANGAEAAGSYLIVATGQQSGATITATNIDSLGTGAGNVVASYVHYLYDGVLTASLNSASPSGTQTPGSGKAIMYLDLTATGDEITINNIEVLMSGSATITGNTAAYWQTLDGSTTYATFAAGTVWMADTSDFDVLNDDSDTTFDTVLKVAAGETKTIRLIGDTTGGATNKTIQASITGSTNTTSGISWQNREGNAVDATLTKNLPVNGGSLVF